jgi:hypothetical protein
MRDAQTQLPQTDGATWQLTGVQLEVGQNPTEFEHEPFERTLAKCQRYFQLTQPNFYHSLAPMLDGASALRGYVKFPVTMRAAPTLTLDVGSGTITTNHNGIDGFNMVGTSTSTIHFLNDYTADAEL